MQEIIEQILEGNFDYENGSLDFSCAKLEIVLSAGESFEGSFQIHSTPGHFCNGYIVSSDYRMECLTPEFTGNDEEIAFCFHGENMEEGDVLKGVFNVISNMGEYYLPFVVTVEHTALQTSMGIIRNLFHFTNLAKGNWQEAVDLFYSAEFSRLFVGSDEKMYDCYRALSSNPGNEQNVEEFLIQINKKQKIEYIIENEELVVELGGIDASYGVSEQTLSIVRNGWGYTALQVECDGDFLFTEKEFIGDEDFVANRYKLPVFIDGSHCRTGKNYGQVVLYNSYVYIVIPVVVKNGDLRIPSRANTSRKRAIVQLMEFYQAFRMKKIGSATWVKESSKIVEELVLADERDVEARLFQAQLLIAEEKYNEAGWLMEHASDLLEKYYDRNSVQWAYYLYLTTLVNKEESYVNQVTDEVDRIFRKDRSKWQVAWFLLYLAEEYNRSASGKWMFLEKQFVNGCTSPVMYTEALYLLNNNPAMLRKLDLYEQQLLYFGAKHQMLSAEVIEQTLYLFGKVREYSRLLFAILTALYEQKKDSRLLQEICALLVKGSKVGKKYLPWYQKGVEAQLRITNLYEYYCMSLDLSENQELPKTLLMYFAYQNNLDSEHSAYLYQYVLQHRGELSDLYDSYRVRIDHFVREQLQKRNISRHLATLYQQVLTPDMIDEETAGAMEQMLFAHQVRVEDSRIHKVYVYQLGNLVPKEYFLQDNAAWIALYGNDNTVVFEDAYGNRFMKNAEYTLERMMLPGKYQNMVAQYVTDSIAFDLYLCEADRRELTPENVERMLRVARSEDIMPSIRKDLYLRVLRYYYDADKMQELDEYLCEIPLDELSMTERGEVLKYMVLRGNFDTAYGWVEKYGPYFVDVKTLVRLISDRMEQTNMLESEMLTAAAWYVFEHGKYNSIIMAYLGRYYTGPVRELRDIWKTALSFEMDCRDLAERCVVQMLYSGAFVGEKMEIFKYYMSNGALGEIADAFLTQCAYDYFVKERLTDAYVFGEIRNLYMQAVPVPWVCKLAYLKYFAENQQEITKEDIPLMEDFLGEMLRKGIHLNFFRELKDFRHMTGMMDDKTIIEYHAKPGARARIHYVMVHENGESDEYVSEYMKEVYGGVFFKEFVLFFGENLHYYIIEESGEEEQLTESGNIQKSDIASGQGSNRYNLINDMIISKTLQDYDTLDSLIEEYYRKDYMNDVLFKLV